MSLSVGAAELRINSTPDSSSILLDGTVVGVTPGQIEISSRQHQLTVSDENSEWSAGLEVSGDAELTVSLADELDSPPYRVLILSRPENAQVKINGVVRGRTPWAGELKAGEHSIELIKEGYSTWTGTLNPNGNFSLWGDLTDKEGFRSTPLPQSDRDTDVYEVKEGAPEGYDQLEKVMGGDLREGWEFVTSGVDPSLKRSRLDQGDVSTDSDGNLSESNTIPFHIKSLPSNATVRIDGRLIGETPLVLDEHPVGSSEVVIKKEGYLTWRERLDLTAPTRLKVKLRKR